MLSYHLMRNKRYEQIILIDDVLKIYHVFSVLKSMVSDVLKINRDTHCTCDISLTCLNSAEVEATPAEGQSTDVEVRHKGTNSTQAAFQSQPVILNFQSLVMLPTAKMANLCGKVVILKHTQ